MSVFYQGFADPALRADIEAAKNLTAEGHTLLAAELPLPAKIEKIISQLEFITDKLSRAFMYCQLTLAADSENRDAFRTLEELSALSVDTQVFESACTRYLGTVPDLDDVIARSEKLKANAFVLREAQREAAHMLPESMIRSARRIVERR